MAMNDRVYIMREAIQRMTQMLAGKSIQVTQRGITAYVRADSQGRPVQVNLPFIPDNATEELIDAIQGFLDHEVAHILFTDFKESTKAASMNTHSMFNIVEDTRIERKMAERFEGSAENLDRCGRFFLEKYITPKLEAAIASGNTDEVEAILIVPLVRSLAGQSAFKDYMRDKMTLVPRTTAMIGHLGPQLETIDSTADAANLAVTMQNALRPGTVGSATPPASPAPPKPPKTSSPPPTPSPAAGDPDDEDEDDSTDPDADDDSTEPDAEDEPTPSAGGDEDGDDLLGDGGDSDDGSGAAGGAIGADGGDDERQMNTTSDGDPLWEAIEKEAKNDFDEMTSRAITNSAADDARGAEYLIFTKENDVVEPLHIGRGFTDDMLTSLQDQVDHMVGPLQKDLERAIAARSLSQWNPGQRSGRMNPSAMARLVGGDDRVFRRKTEVTSKDVAVELVVDMSGSMGGSKIHTASKVAYALASTLERIGIPCEVICFTTGGSVFPDHATMSAEVTKIGRRYSRADALYMPILKTFSERMSTDIKKRFAWLPNCSSMACNIDGESVEVAARRLMARREKGKILMVLSDGAPAGSGDPKELYQHLKKTVLEITRRGINVLGIGIESTDVQKFYPKYLIIQNVSDLPTVVMKELRTLIMK